MSRAGDELEAVSSHRHQAIGRIGGGLAPTGEAPDAVVEAIEDPARSFCLGVLRHREREARDMGLQLFRGLVEAARAYAAAPPAGVALKGGASTRETPSQ